MVFSYQCFKELYIYVKHVTSKLFLILQSKEAKFRNIVNKYLIDHMKITQTQVSEIEVCTFVLYAL